MEQEQVNQLSKITIPYDWSLNFQDNLNRFIEYYLSLIDFIGPIAYKTETLTILVKNQKASEDCWLDMKEFHEIFQFIPTEAKNKLQYVLQRYPEELIERFQKQSKGQDQPQKVKQDTIFRLNNSSFHQESASTEARQESFACSSPLQVRQIMQQLKLNQSKNKLNENQVEPDTPRFTDSRKNEEAQQLQQDIHLSIPKSGMSQSKINEKPNLFFQDQAQFQSLNEFEMHDSNLDIESYIEDNSDFEDFQEHEHFHLSKSQNQSRKNIFHTRKSPRRIMSPNYSPMRKNHRQISKQRQAGNHSKQMNIGKSQKKYKDNDAIEAIGQLKNTYFHDLEDLRKKFMNILIARNRQFKPLIYETNSYVYLKCEQCRLFQVWFKRDPKHGGLIEWFRNINLNHYDGLH
ncbi:UNKNOWN [Stylonychia lemnae]|uniref:Uncharacterized protein n=1 Tax=Stylonychia lemnae TaxID=5949 RepID=A0A078ALA0_STYLE|nr:UNKNOWN [Stylonychia lemnae]|eukprot:CDW83140.1 UNKNOWN [Stylonychia lemnae]